MRPAELADLLAGRDIPTAGEIEAFSTAIGQRSVRLNPTVSLEDLTDCAGCGLLLVELPRPVRLRRTYAVGGVPMGTTIEIRDAHAARHDDGRLACAAYFDDPDVCELHDPHMCDTPVLRLPLLRRPGGTRQPALPQPRPRARPDM